MRVISLAFLLFASVKASPRNENVGQEVTVTVTEGTEQSSGWVRRLKRHKWKEDSNEAQTSNTAPHLDSVIGGKTTTAKESNAPKRDKRNGMGKRAKPVMGVNNISNSTLAKKSKENKDSDSSNKNEGEKEKLSLPTSTPTSYPTSADSIMSPPSLDANDTPFAQPVAAPVILVPVFDGPTATPAVPISPFSPVAIPAVSTVSKIDNNSFETAQTALPTSSPTIKLLATAEQHHFTRTVQAHPLFLRVVGQFDPKEEEEEFFVIVKEGFKPYSRAYISEMLNEYDIAMLFLNDLIQETKEANGTVLTTSWCQVNVTFEVASETESTVNHFTTEKASQLVVKFFMDGHKTRLINGFDQADIAVLDIEALEVLPNDVKAILDAATGSASRSGEPPPLNDEPSGSSKSSIAVLAASGGVMLLALGAIVLTRRNNKRVSDMHGSASLVPGDDIDKYPSKALAFVSGESLNEVKPAALQVRNRRERARQAVMSSNNTVATYFTTETALSNFTKVEKYSAAKGEVQASETRLVDIAAFSALTCLNGKESVGALNKAYPEFEMYQSSASPPPSPVWSIDNYSNASPYSVDDDYVAERRRWHDVANDLDMIALPDTNSEYSSHHSRDSQARKMDEI